MQGRLLNSSIHLYLEFAPLLLSLPITSDFLQENAEERRIRENERKKVYNITNPHQKRPTKLSHDAKSWVAKLKDLKETNTKDGKHLLYFHKSNGNFLSFPNVSN